MLKRYFRIMDDMYVARLASLFVVIDLPFSDFLSTVFLTYPLMVRVGFIIVFSFQYGYWLWKTDVKVTWNFKTRKVTVTTNWSVRTFVF